MWRWYQEQRRRLYQKDNFALIHRPGRSCAQDIQERRLRWSISCHSNKIANIYITTSAATRDTIKKGKSLFVHPPPHPLLDGAHAQGHCFCSVALEWQQPACLWSLSVCCIESCVWSALSTCMQEVSLFSSSFGIRPQYAASFASNVNSWPSARI